MRLAALLLLPLALAHAAAPLTNAHRRHHAALAVRQRPGGPPDDDDDDVSPVSSSIGDDDEPSSSAAASSSSSTSSSAIVSSTTSSTRSLSSAAPTSSATPSSTSSTTSSTRSTSSAAPTEPPTSSPEPSPSVAPSSSTTTSSTVSESPSSTTTAPTSVLPSSSSSRSSSRSSSSSSRSLSSSSSRTTNSLTWTPDPNPPTLVSKPTASSRSTSKPSASAAKSDEQSSGLPKPALIAIIVIAIFIGGSIIIFTLFRKWKLRPSRRFDDRLKPIDFSPTDTYFEKNRASLDEASLQRRQFVADLDNDKGGLVGDLHHDFTAGPTVAPGVGAYGGGMYQHHQDPYHSDPYARDHHGSDFSHSASAYGTARDHASSHDHSPPVQDDYSYQQAVRSPVQDPVQPHPLQQAYYNGASEAPSQDDGYGYIVPGPGVATASPAHSAHAQLPAAHGSPAPVPLTGGEFFSPDFSVNGRPTGSDGGAYAQAATYRY